METKFKNSNSNFIGAFRQTPYGHESVFFQNQCKDRGRSQGTRTLFTPPVYSPHCTPTCHPILPAWPAKSMEEHGSHAALSLPHVLSLPLDRRVSPSPLQLDQAPPSESEHPELPLPCPVPLHTETLATRRRGRCSARQPSRSRQHVPLSLLSLTDTSPTAPVPSGGRTHARLTVLAMPWSSRCSRQHTKP